MKTLKLLLAFFAVSRITRIPVRGLKRPVVPVEDEAMAPPSYYPNPRKGTETKDKDEVIDSNFVVVLPESP